MRKKIRFKKVVGGIALSLAMLATVPAFAVTNYGWSATASSYGVNIKTAQKMKYTNSSVIANYTDGPSEQMAVTVQAKVNGSWVDSTYYNNNNFIYVVSESDSEYVEVLNMVYENYGRSYTRVSFAVGSPGDHNGWWRPDVN